MAVSDESNLRSNRVLCFSSDFEITTEKKDACRLLGDSKENKPKSPWI